MTTTEQIKYEDMVDSLTMYGWKEKEARNRVAGRLTKERQVAHEQLQDKLQE